MEVASNFPTGPFGGSPKLLEGLCKLGMVSRVTPAAALKMARFVEATFVKDSQEGHAL